MDNNINNNNSADDDNVKNFDNNQSKKIPLLIIFAAMGTEKSHFVKRFSDKFIDGNDLVFYDIFSKELFIQKHVEEFNELFRKRYDNYNGNKIILSSYYLHLPNSRTIFHRMVYPTEKYYEQDFIWNDVQNKYHD